MYSWLKNVAFVVLGPFNDVISRDLARTRPCPNLGVVRERGGNIGYNSLACGKSVKCTRANLKPENDAEQTPWMLLLDAR